MPSSSSRIGGWKIIVLPTALLSVASSIYVMFSVTPILVDFANSSVVIGDEYMSSSSSSSSSSYNHSATTTITFDEIPNGILAPRIPQQPPSQPLTEVDILSARIHKLSKKFMKDLMSPHHAMPLARCFDNEDLSEENGGHDHSNLWQTCMPVYLGKHQLGARPYGNEPYDKNGVPYSHCRGDHHSRFRKEGVCPFPQNEEMPEARLPFDLYRFGRVLKPEELWFVHNYTQKGCFGVEGTSQNSVCFPRDRLQGFASDCFYAPDRPKTILCLPKWIGLGLHKSGSTALFHFIKINFPTYRYRKERRFFNPSRGETTFNSSVPMSCRFPNMKCYLGDGAHAGPKGIHGDLTVPLTFYIHAPLFVEQVQPQAKFIITLRDPIDLLWSRFHFNKMKTSDLKESILMGLEWFLDCQERSIWRRQTGAGWDPGCSFQSAAAEEIAIQINNTDLSTGLRLIRDGLFADTIHLWLARFNYSQFLFVPNSQLREESAVEHLTNSIASFLDVPPYEKRPDFVTRNIANKTSLHLRDLYPDVVELLETFFRPHRYWLSQLSGIPEDDVF
ncbi:MAG: hypothetical protein SGBAC_010588 [Bacillariaceae sp.]